MSLFEDTNPRALKELLGQIESKASALPDFQRDFVWDPSATQELVVSVANGYPAGSILRIRNTHNLFASREFQGAPPLDGQKPTYLILDGQQRQTSLYQAFYGVGEHRYFLKVGDLLDGKDFEECIFHLRANHKSAKRYEAFDIQAQELIMPLSTLKQGAGGFLQWSVQVAQERAGADGGMDFLKRLNSDIGAHWMQKIDDYHFPVVTLSDETDAEAVCTIFETLNRTGVRLSPFELLTARFWPKEISLRQMWSKALSDHPIIGEFEVDPYYLMQVISLLARQAPSCRRSDVLNLKPKDVASWWERAVRGLAATLGILQDDCGVLTGKWLPYYTMLMPMAAVVAKHDSLVGPAVGAARDKLHRWFWCSVLGQTYENAANSQSAKDVTELSRWIDGGAAPETVASFRFDPKILRDTTPNQRALYRGIIALVLRSQPRDFHKTGLITADLMREQEIDDHHVFPQGFLAGKPEVSGRLRDCVLNRTLIDKRTNIRISDRAPSDYLMEMRDEFDKDHPGHLDALLESHLLPSSTLLAFAQDDFDAYLQLRQEAVWKAIQGVTGVTVASDLVS